MVFVALRISIILDNLLDNLSRLSQSVTSLWDTLARPFIFPIAAGIAAGSSDFGFVVIWTEGSLKKSGSDSAGTDFDRIQSQYPVWK